MNQEARELLEAARGKKPEDFIEEGTLYDGWKKYCGYLHSVIFQALTLKNQQPAAGELTKHIREQVRYICEMMQGKHKEEEVDWEALLTQVLALCGSYDTSESTNKDLLAACKLIYERIYKNGNWDDNCFYYHNTSASELEEPLELLKSALAKAKKEGEGSNESSLKSL